MTLVEGRVCRRCGGGISEQRLRRRAVFCTKDCQQEAWRDRYGRQRDGLAEGLHTATIGAVSELAVSTDLLARGVEVFRAMSHGAPCDLLALRRDGRILRVEVRTGHRRSDGEMGGVIKFPKDEGRSDCYAVVIHSEPREVVYLTPDLVEIDDVETFGS